MIISYSYCYWYDFPGPTGDRVDVMLPTYGYDNSKVEWDGNMYPDTTLKIILILNVRGFQPKE